MFRLDGKTALIAGSCGLIGKAVYDLFKDVGANVEGIDKAETADLQIDVADIGKELWLFENRVDIFVNATYPSEFFIHLATFMFSGEDVAQYMADMGGGAIINIASIYGMVGPKWDIYLNTKVDPTVPAYSAIKGGIIAHTRALACKYGKNNVRVNAISPGGVWNNHDSMFDHNYSQETPLGRMASPEDIAYACLFLASDEASYITGINLAVDGGWTAW